MSSFESALCLIWVEDIYIIIIIIYYYYYYYFIIIIIIINNNIIMLFGAVVPRIYLFISFCPPLWNKW